MASKRDQIQKLLRGIETGDPEAATVVNEAKYIQHNPRTGEGSEGLVERFARLAKTNARVTFLRVFEDGDFAFAHNEYDFAGVEVAFEVFRFEDGKVVEDWDNIQMKQPPNPSGRNMLDGETAITDLDKTEANRDLVRMFARRVLVDRQFNLLETYIDDGLIQHDPEVADGIAAMRTKLKTEANGTPRIEYYKAHRVTRGGKLRSLHERGQKGGPPFRHLRSLPSRQRNDRGVLEYGLTDCPPQRVEEREWEVLRPQTPRFATGHRLSRGRS